MPSILSDINHFMDLVESLGEVEQTPRYHPEGNALIHTIQVVKWAFKESDDLELLLAALLHDVGKKERSDGHEKIAVEWLKPYCTSKTIWLIDNHIRIRYYLEGSMKKYAKCRDLFENKWFKDLILLYRWDSMGRSPSVKTIYNRQYIIDRFNKKLQERICLNF